MKSKLIRSTLLGVISLGALMLASCQSSSSAPTSAVSCDKCGTIHFKAYVPGSPAGKGIATLTDSSRMACPDCKNEVVALLKSGIATKHVCKSCGGTLRHCTQH